jgi:hypothetical protein
MGRSNKVLVPTLPAGGGFDIIARHTGLNRRANLVLPVTARAGRTTPALGFSIL